MKFSRVSPICAALLMLAAAPGFAQDAGAPGRGPGGGGGAGGGRGPAIPGLALTTMGFPDGGEIPAKYTAAVPNPVSPDLEWTNVPASTVSFVLILHDADTSVQKGTDDILHWMMFNIPGTVHGLPEGVPATAALPDGSVQGKNRRGTPGFMAPAPPAGPFHHYTFELYALDIKLDLGPDATRGDVLKAMDGHIVGKAVLVGRFHR
jgi:Raf kinase inhibitor-like YbhB/YbcL family protein